MSERLWTGEVTTVNVQPNVNDDASHVHSIVCWRCTQPHVLGINDFITFSGVLLYYIFSLYRSMGLFLTRGMVVQALLQFTLNRNINATLV